MTTQNKTVGRVCKGLLAMLLSVLLTVEPLGTAFAEELVQDADSEQDALVVGEEGSSNEGAQESEDESAQESEDEASFTQEVEQAAQSDEETIETTDDQAASSNETSSAEEASSETLLSTQDSSSIAWTGATEITSATTTTGETYASTTASQNAVLVNTDEAVTLTNPFVTKSGGTSAGDDESFYGINSAVMCKGGGTTTITGATVTTDAAGANGVFSFGGNASTNATSGDGTTVVISDSTITTTGDGSGGIMTTGQGVTKASNLTVKTSGGSSAAIRSDRGGGTVTVDGGTYETSGTGSPAVYATATIDVSNATLTSTNSQGIVNEGGNTVTLTDCTLNANNATLNGQDNFKNGVFLYQSMSGDATDGASVFKMTGGTLNNTCGHVFHVTNTSAAITLEGVTINNEDSEGVLISVCDDGWSGLDNEATINAVDQTLAGNLLVGDGDTLNMNLSGTSTWTGTTSGSITSHKDSTAISSSLGTVNLTLSDSATIVLTADTTVSSLSGSGYIDYNGYTLTVGSTPYTSGNIGNVVEKSSESTTTYTVTVNEATNGTVKASATTAAEGDSITLTTTPADGYELSTLTVVDASNNEVTVSNNAFTMPASNVTVTATFSAKASSTTTADYTAHLTFSDSAIIETDAGAGYSISGTTLTIASAGTYHLSGSCSEGAVIVNASDVVVELDGLTLTSSNTAPIVVKKTCTDVHIHLEDGTTSTITNNENPANETSTDTEVADAFEGACIKAKTDSSVCFCGGGNLKCVANTKNAIKGGTNATLTFNTTGTVTVSGSYSGSATSAGAVNNGIASDGALVFNAGTYVVAAANDGIKAVPDTDDTTSAGDITINGGTFDIDVDGDGIQAEHNLTINAGSFDIKTMSGYTTSTSIYSEDTMSCKGIKASGDREDVENTITVNGGDFDINTIDDAVHSDTYALIKAGSFDIYTGDDGMHADTTLTLGTSGGYERDPDVNIAYSYEGLEGGTVYVYSGRHYVYATDDGVNAAGGSSNGSNTSRGNDGFKSWGGSSGSSNYNLYFYGGETYVNCNGDGLDSNGGLYLYGGKQAVFSQSSGDNSAIDADGTVSIKGSTILTAGIAGVDGKAQSSWFGSNQKYTASSTSYSANTILNAMASSTIVMSYKLPKKVSYVMASWPTSVSSTAPTFATASSLTSCKSSSWEHNWNSGSTSNGVTTYTCSSCGATERQTTATGATVTDCDHTVEVEEVTEYTATFSVVDGDGAASSNATINTYYTQDYSSVSESGVTTAIARDSDTGNADVSGSGQINFTVVPAEGYNVDNVSVSGSYKNLKGPSDTGVANTYRITKVAGDLTVTVTVSACAHANVGNPTWTWSDDYTTATASFVCSNCGNTVTADGTVTSELTDASTITFTATAELGENTYTSTKTAAPFTGTFSIVDTDGKASTNATINSYYTQDYTTASETDVTTAAARDGDSGNPVRSGGQINFAVVPADGYTVQSVTATDGTYNKIKGPADTAAANTYRLTKVSADTTITVTLAKCDHANLSDPTWTWSDDYATATAAFECSGCGSTLYYVASVSAGSITSSLNTSTNTMTYTAAVTVNETAYTDTQTVNVYPVQFDAANATIDVYYTQDYTSADETNVQTAVARDGDTGEVLTDGTGQVNFKVTPATGYQIDSVTADANYKNLKDSTDTGVENVYRLTKVTGTVNVTVATSKITHTVTFDANGHGTAPSAQTVEYGEKATQPDDLTETGYVFGGWYTEEDCTNAYDFSTAVTDDLTLYAKWTEASYTVSYNANGGSGSIESATVAHGATVTLSTDGLTAPSGKTFVCWSTSADGTGTCYAKTATVTITADTTFYAIWAETSTTSYIVTTDEATGGTVAATPTSQTVGEDVTVTATPNTGYQLTAITYTLGNSSVTAWEGTATSETTATFSMPAENTTVTATFEKIDYTITLSVVDTDGEELEGATLTASPSPANYGDTVTLSLDLSDAAGYTLKGWTVVSGSITITVSDNAYTFTMPASNVEIKAVCEQIAYTATFSATNATINTYYTQDYSTASATSVTTAIARDSETGAIDGTGLGQINFTVVPTDGYVVTNVSVTPTSGYKNLKDISSSVGVDNTYRITKVTSDLTVSVTALKEVAVPTGESLTYTTYEQTGVAEGEGYTLSGDYKATNAGTYTATATPASGYAWEDGTTEAKSISWTIAPVSVTAPTAKTGLTYNGSVQVGVATGSYYTLSGTYQAANAGSYTATVALDDTTNYQWSDGTTDDKSYSWSIAKVKVALPTAKSGLTYNGSAQVGVATGNYYTLSGTYKATNAGSYIAKATLVNTTNYQWIGGATAARSIVWVIAQRAITDSAITVSSVATQAWTGSAITPTPTVKYGSTTLTAGTHYTLSYANNKNAGTATITITGKGNFKGSRTISFKIVAPSVTYRTHVQNVGWQSWRSDGAMAGTSGRSLRLEAINLKLAAQPASGSIQYRTHVQDVGWQGWVSDGAMSGTSGRSLRLEAIQVRLTGSMAELYDVWYRVHAQDVGWMGWAKDGASAGTAHYSRRLEAIQVVLLPKGSSAPSASYGGLAQATSSAFLDRDDPDQTTPAVAYRTHVQDVGWQTWRRNGTMAGTSGRSLRLEAINVKLVGYEESGSIQYRTHVQNIGWQDWVSDGAMSGTSGRSLRLEAIQVRLTGEMAEAYDVWYRVHAQNLGWMAWAKDGASAGTAHHSYRLEAMQVVILPKGSSAPSTTYKGVTQAYGAAFKG